MRKILDPAPARGTAINVMARARQQMIADGCVKNVCERRGHLAVNRVCLSRGHVKMF